MTQNGKKRRPLVCLVMLLVLLFLTGCQKEKSEDFVIVIRAKALHHRILTVDTHTDTPFQLLKKGWDFTAYHETGVPGSGRLDLPRMKRGGLDAAFLAVFVSQGERSPAGDARAKAQAVRIIDMIRSLSGHPEAVIGLEPEDMIKSEAEGKRTLSLGMENGYPLGMDLSLVGLFHDLGVRDITLCHQKNNDLCDSSTDPAGPEWHGLSPFGEAVVGEMNRLGLIVDVSHLSDEACFDVLAVSRAPVIASHSCCCALYDSPRNVSDAMLEALRENGGVIQIALCSFFIQPTGDNPRQRTALDSLKKRGGEFEALSDPQARQDYLNAYFDILERYPDDLATVEEFVDHIDHAVRIAGTDHVGIGSDFDGGAMREEVADVSEIPRITEELLRRGYSEKEIRKIWGENFLRVFREVRRRRAG